MVAYALSRRPYLTLNYLLALPRDLCEDCKKLEINVVTRRDKATLYTLEIQRTFIEEIRGARNTN